MNSSQVNVRIEEPITGYRRFATDFQSKDVGIWLLHQ